jgi:predicted HTH transcriptional regulator
MTKEELIQKLACLEWEDFEVKAAKSELPKSLWESVSAFSNTSGGWIGLGVKENGNEFEITGVRNAEKLEQDFLNTLRGTKFNVFVSTTQEVYRFDDKTVLTFYVPVHKNKPVYYNNQRNTFIRRGSSDQRATQEEIDSMLRDRAFGTKTAELAPGSNRESLNNTSINRYRDYMARFNPNASYNRYDEAEFLEKLRIMEKGNCTFAGVLMFGKREVIEKYFSDFRVDLLEVPGKSYSEAKQ